MKGLLYTYLATYLGAVLAVFYPLVGLFLFINFAIIKPPSMWYWAVPASNYSEILGGGMLIGWALKGFGDWRFGRGAAVVLMLIGFLGWAVICTAVSDTPSVGWAFVVWIFKIVVPFLVGLTLIDTPKKLRILLWVLALSQGYLAFELNLSYFSGFNRMQMEGFGGVDNNIVAAAMVAGIGLAFFLGLGERRIWAKGVAFLAAALMIHAVMFSFSRGGVLSLIITGVVSFILVARKPIHILLFVVAMLLALRMAGPEVRQRFSTTFAEAEDRDSSVTNRLEFWGICWDMMKKHPVFGVGPDQYPIVASAEYGRGGYAHSMWLQTGAEMGFPGLAMLLAFYGICLWRLFPLTWANSQVSDPWLREVARMVIASLSGFLLAAQFLSIPGLELPYYIVLAGVIVLKLNSVPTTRPGASPLPYNSLVRQ